MVKAMYDYLIVGAGLFGAAFAYSMRHHGKKCLVIEKDCEVGGACKTESINGILVHKCGPHIFHTSNEFIWEFVNGICDFEPFVNSPIARYENEVFNLPFNMNTFAKIYPGVITPEDAMDAIRKDGGFVTCHPRNLEEKAISMVGRTIFEKLVRGYTEKQWGKECSELPPDIIHRLPLRFTFDNNYFNDRWQGIPVCGYSEMIRRMLKGSELMLRTEYEPEMKRCAKKVIYTGKIDEYFEYEFGALEYRSCEFRTKILRGTSNYQGNAVINYTCKEVPYTRVIEHKHFTKSQHQLDDTVISFEYPCSHNDFNEPLYPIPNKDNDALYAKYKKKSRKEKNVFFGGRCGEYKYYNMDYTMASALSLADKLLYRS